MSAITVKPDGTATWHGVDAGPLTLHHITPGLLVLKAASHSVWTGIGQHATAATRFYVFTITDTAAPHTAGRVENGRTYSVEKVCDFPLRKGAS